MFQGPMPKHCTLLDMSGYGPSNIRMKSFDSEMSQKRKPRQSSRLLTRFAAANLSLQAAAIFPVPGELISKKQRILNSTI